MGRGPLCEVGEGVRAALGHLEAVEGIAVHVGACDEALKVQCVVGGATRGSELLHARRQDGRRRGEGRREVGPGALRILELLEPAHVDLMLALPLLIELWTHGERRREKGRGVEGRGRIG